MQLFTLLHKNAFVDYKTALFALSHFQKNSQLESKYRGWEVYNIEKEFERMHLDISKDIESKDKLFKYIDNTNGNHCSTYPDKLVL